MIKLTRKYLFFYFILCTCYSVDDDECAGGVVGCSHGCRNTPGHYTCICPAGFMLQADSKNCTGNFTNGKSVNLYYIIITITNNSFFLEILHNFFLMK